MTNILRAPLPPTPPSDFETTGEMESLRALARACKRETSHAQTEFGTTPRLTESAGDLAARISGDFKVVDRSITSSTAALIASNIDDSLITADDRLGERKGDVASGRTRLGDDVTAKSTVARNSLRRW